jgi:hypothetical protein
MSLALNKLLKTEKKECDARTKEAFEEMLKAMEGELITYRQQIEDLKKSPPSLIQALYDLCPDRFIVLDLSRDPDPHGNHGYSLANRLRYMAWTDE